jgi:hypothetical protein
MNWKGFGRNRSWHNRDNLLEFAWKDLGHSRKTPVMIAGVPSEIQTQHFTDTNLERCHYIKLLGIIG